MKQEKAILDQPQIDDNPSEQPEALRKATERAQRAEAELARLKANQPSSVSSEESRSKLSPATQSKAAELTYEPISSTPSLESEDKGGIEELRKDSMMVHLLDSLAAGKDIGHYGRLVFAMVARHFLPHEEVLKHLTQDKDFSEEQAVLMLRQVEGRDYNPPRRERLLEWQGQQDFPILPNPEDPDCGNLYRNLKFPTKIYDHIGHYQEEKLQAGE